MSLDVYLEDEKGEELYWANITHNLARMAGEAGIYEAMWRPDEAGFGYAGQLVPTLKGGLMKLVLSPSHFQQFNAPNGWGKWEHFVPFVARYLEACEQNPDARVRVSR